MNPRCFASWFQEWELLLDHDCRRELSASAGGVNPASIPASALGFQKPRTTCRLCKPRTLQTLIRCHFGHASHTSPLLCTGLFAPPVGDVGNGCPNTLRIARFSNSPELHNRDLDNFSHSQPTRFKPLQPYFHFSYDNYGYYCLISYLLFVFLLPVAHLASRGNNAELSGLGSVIWQLLNFCNSPGNPEMHPCFPRASMEEGEYNQR